MGLIVFLKERVGGRAMDEMEGTEVLPLEPRIRRVREHESVFLQPGKLERAVLRCRSYSDIHAWPLTASFVGDVPPSLLLVQAVPYILKRLVHFSTQQVPLTRPMNGSEILLARKMGILSV